MEKKQIVLHAGILQGRFDSSLAQQWRRDFFGNVTQKIRTLRADLPRWLGIAILDFDNDGWPGHSAFKRHAARTSFYRNNGNGTFTEKSHRRGAVAFSEDGVRLAPAWAWTPPITTAAGTPA